MADPKVVRLIDTETVSFGPLSSYQPIIGDEAGTTARGMPATRCGKPVSNS